MLWLDRKYVLLLSGRLRNFKKKNQDTYNFSCPICGDSSKDKRKARGWIYLKKGQLRYFCHNCNDARNIQHLIKYLDPGLHTEYVKEKLSEAGDDTKTLFEEFKKPVFVRTTGLKDLKKVSALAHDHPVKAYVDKRMIPTTLHWKLFYAPKFKAWVNSMVPGKFKSIENDEPRLIIPFLDKDKNLFGFQGRSFSKTGMRYITIMLDQDKPKVFGLDSIDQNKPVYVFEGPIDSMFVPNSIASAGGDVTSHLRMTDIPKNKIVVVYDNERRSIHTVHKMAKSIDDGYKICIWPDYIIEKDVNDMVLSGKTPDQIKDIIDNNTYCGLEAKLHLTIWRRCNEGFGYNKTNKESSERSKRPDLLDSL